MTAKLVAKFDEPNLEGCELLIAKNDGWIIRTVAKDGNNPSWSTWVPLSETKLRNTILMVHLGLSEEKADEIINRQK